MDEKTKTEILKKLDILLWRVVDKNGYQEMADGVSHSIEVVKNILEKKKTKMKKWIVTFNDVWRGWREETTEGTDEIDALLNWREKTNCEAGTGVHAKEVK